MWMKKIFSDLHPGMLSVWIKKAQTIELVRHTAPYSKIHTNNETVSGVIY